MNGKRAHSIWVLIVVSAFVSVALSHAVAQSTCSLPPCNSAYSVRASHATDAFKGSCTTFAASSGNTVLFGNNEDFKNSDTYLWTVPSAEGAYGGVYVGYRYGRPQGGINERGLAFDALALPAAGLNPRPELSKVRIDSQFLERIMSQCATVAEAITFAQTFNWGSSISFQVLLADATGDAVVIGAGPDGELAFTRMPKEGSYLVATNFNRANPENHSGSLPCRRYDTTVEKLARVEAGNGLDVAYVRSILDTVHVEGPSENTLYSNVFDLKNGVIHLYYWHQFDEGVTLTVPDALASGISPMKLSNLFSEKTVMQAAEEYQRHVRRAAREDWLSQNGQVAVGGALVACLGLVAVGMYKLRNGRKGGQLR